MKYGEVIREDLLHYIWKYKKFPLQKLVSEDKEEVAILDVGVHNHLAGPDFFNAQICIDNQLWAGNVEIHIKSSDWYTHGHERDVKYNNVILHVVWEDDAVVFRRDGSKIPTLELKRVVPKQLLGRYWDLMDKRGQRFINCENNLDQIDSFLVKKWQESLFFERLEHKSQIVKALLDESKNNWEQVLFAMLLKSFGSKINGASFFSLAKAVDFSIVRKLQRDVFKLESLFFGLSGLLESNVTDNYFLELKKEYGYLDTKFGLGAKWVAHPDFFKLRPSNFPTIRLSQMANLYATHANLFNEVVTAKKLSELYTLFTVSASSYWDTHYTFGKESRGYKKRLTRPFIDLLVVNTILPLKLCYSTYMGRDLKPEIQSLAKEIKKERNTIVDRFGKLGLPVKSATESQAVIQLYNHYCSQNKCLQCSIGNSLLHGNF